MQSPKRINLSQNVNGSDVLFNDDGNGAPDDFDGWDDGWSMYWANEFNLQGISFELDAIQVYESLMGISCKSSKTPAALQQA